MIIRVNALTLSRVQIVDEHYLSGLSFMATTKQIGIGDGHAIPRILVLRQYLDSITRKQRQVVRPSRPEIWTQPP